MEGTDVLEIKEVCKKLENMQDNLGRPRYSKGQASYDLNPIIYKLEKIIEKNKNC